MVVETKQSPRVSVVRTGFVVAAALFLVGVLRFAWASDDAFITLRIVDNLTHGFGAVTNEGTRVQAFTHPLWFLLLVPIHLISREGYATLLSANLICALGLVVAVRWGAKAQAGTIALLLLAASYSYLCFTTSGLESSLTYVLLAVVAGYAVREESVLALWIAGGLLVLNRFDLVLVVAPLLATTLRPITIGRTARLLACLLPLGLWLLFSLLYYGSVFPNTAYAKLNLAIPRPQLLAQGVSYLVTSASTDPILVLLLCLGVPALFSLGGRLRWLGAGALLYLAYVVWIGGDFMAGRLLTAPATLCALGIGLWVDGTTARDTSLTQLPVIFSLVSLILATHNVAWSDESPNPKSTCAVPKSGIVDERRCYYGHTALTQNVRVQKYKTHPYYEKGREWRATKGGDVVVSTLIGLSGYAAGPSVTLIDRYGLSDPLLARLPFTPARSWRVGHFQRPLPLGYVESRKTRVNVVEDPCIRDLYDDVLLVTEGPLLSGERIGAIARLGLGLHRCKPSTSSAKTH